MHRLILSVRGVSTLSSAATDENVVVGFLESDLQRIVMGNRDMLAIHSHHRID